MNQQQKSDLLHERADSDSRQQLSNQSNAAFKFRPAISSQNQPMSNYSSR